MSTEAWLAILAGTTALIGVGMALSLYVIHRQVIDRRDEIDHLNVKLQGNEARITRLEIASRGEFTSAVGTAGAEQHLTRDPSRGSVQDGFRRVPMGTSEIRIEDQGERGADFSSGRTAIAQVSPLPPLTVNTAPVVEDFYEKAARALDTALAFNRFVESFPGLGYLLEAEGPAPLPQGATIDRADILVVSNSDARFVLPAFNLRRGQALLTSDSGRAAEAKLGWLFEIVPGPELRAVEGAWIEPDSWTIKRKGRLSVPL